MPLAFCHQIPAGARALQVSTFDTAVFIGRSSYPIVIYVIAVAHALHSTTVSVRFHVDLDLHYVHFVF